MKNNLGYVLACLLLAGVSGCVNAGQELFSIRRDTADFHIYVDAGSDYLIKWAAAELAGGMEEILGREISIKPAQSFNPDSKGIFIGAASDSLEKQLPGKFFSEIKDKWEHFGIHRSGDQVFVLGSDVRGTAYGVFELAERMGISPWIWWADVPPEKREGISLAIPKEGIQEGPSVEYRGIFLNDEDWGLQPWAAQTFEPEVGDIGPKTYEKIFQLLIRLKANVIWPAMHPSTRAFYSIPGNKEMADKYHIVIGTSHAEPMLRNNVDEWKHNDFGDFNYFTNSETVRKYWQGRIEEVREGNVMVTVGMRGIHDSGMEGKHSTEEKVAMLERIIRDQRQILTETMEKPIEEIPQVFIPYKEVLGLYDAGLKVPEDITIIWTDDNYGYIRRLSDEAEQQRKGGSGVYYHLSYWGRPHDYLWLSSTQPGLIWYEMSRAYQNGAHKIWILNVGDIKPAEYSTEFFLDLAWNVNSIGRESIKTHLVRWCEREFGQEMASEMADLKEEYYRLAFLRKPEYMGWSQTEPTTGTQLSGFSLANGNEVQRRIEAYEKLATGVRQLKPRIPSEKQDAYFQLIEYPIHCAALMNHKFLYAQLAFYEKNPEKREMLLGKSREAFDQIGELTRRYNEEVADGKWKGIMSMNPRGLPVFDMPDFSPADSLEDRIDSASPAGDASLGPVFIRASSFAASFSPEGHSWQAIEGLGYSQNSMTLFPLGHHTFEGEYPYLEYEFDVKKKGKYVVEVRCLPTHSNDFGQQMWMEMNGRASDTLSLNTRGRSKTWKTNVLRNYVSARFSVDLEKVGRQSLKVFVNQTGMVLDQVAITPEGYPDYYEAVVE